MIRNIIVKVTLDCNIACKYCYVQRNRGGKYEHQTMTESTLAALLFQVGEYLRAQPSPEEIVLYWHGGEPLRAGRAFFERCRALQDEHLPPHVKVVNTIQTNGLLITDEWARFVRESGFGVCVSLDGPADIHDAWRRSKDALGTYEGVVRGIEVLRRHEVPISILAVITPEALPHGARIYHALRDLGCEWMDFMYPFYSQIDNTIDVSIDPAQWGQFLVDVFDQWMEEGDPRVTVRLLADMCLALMNGRTQMCISGVDCSYVITIYPNGDVFICDDLLSYADSMLGSVHHDSLRAISSHPRLARLKNKEFLFGDDCLTCDMFPVCRGGCTLFRARRKNDFLGRHYFCASQRRIVSHVQEYFRDMKVEARS